MNRLRVPHSIGAPLLALATACGPAAAPPADDEAELSLPFDTYVLDNGLEVVLHEDHSDPIAAVAMLYHVGSARETPGRTGFAHLFEHLLFQNSENVGPGGFLNGVPAIGGTFNGGTSNDSTIYYAVVPNDALERVLWMESDPARFLHQHGQRAGSRERRSRSSRTRSARAMTTDPTDTRPTSSTPPCSPRTIPIAGR